MIPLDVAMWLLAFTFAGVVFAVDALVDLLGFSTNIGG